MMLYGAGGHGKVVSTVCVDTMKLFFDENKSTSLVNGFKVQTYDPNIFVDDEVVVTIGDNQIRKNVVNQIEHEFGIILDISALISKDVQIGEGSQILHGVVIQVDTEIGCHCIINSSASVDHDCKIADFVHIAPNATLCGSVVIGEGSFIGAGATVLPGICVGDWCTIGAGAVVINNVIDGTTVVGNPAKELL